MSVLNLVPVLIVDRILFQCLFGAVNPSIDMRHSNVSRESLPSLNFLHSLFTMLANVV